LFGYLHSYLTVPLGMLSTDFWKWMPWGWKKHHFCRTWCLHTDILETVVHFTISVRPGLCVQLLLCSRLSALEELSGVEILASDKTGTLTLNK